MKSFNATPNSLSTLYVSKDLIQKGNIQNLTDLILNTLRKKTNQFFLI